MKGENMDEKDDNKEKIREMIRRYGLSNIVYVK